MLDENEKGPVGLSAAPININNEIFRHPDSDRDRDDIFIASVVLCGVFQASTTSVSAQQETKVVLIGSDHETTMMRPCHAIPCVINSDINLHHHSTSPKHAITAFATIVALRYYRQCPPRESQVRQRLL